MAVERPDGIPADGMTKVVVVPTLANPAAPTATELNSVSAIDITGLLTADGWAPGADEQAISDARLVDNQDYERRGRIRHTLQLTYVRAQEAAKDLAFTTLVPGYTGYAVARYDADPDDAFAADDVVSVYAIEAGERIPVPPEANAMSRRTQRMFIRNTCAMDVAVTAGA